MDDVDLTSSILTRCTTSASGWPSTTSGRALVLGYLARFPIDVVKIDRSFVRALSTTRCSRRIVSAVVALSEAIGSTTVVEGVETRPQLGGSDELSVATCAGLLLRAPGLGRRFQHHAERQRQHPPGVAVVRGERAG